MLRAKILRFWFPVVLYSGIIFTVSSFHRLPTAIGKWHLDSVLHVFEYLPFGFLIARALRNTVWNQKQSRNLVFLTAILALLYGMSDEWHQSFVVGRDSSALDVFADTIGGLLGAVGFVWLETLKSQKRRKM